MKPLWLYRLSLIPSKFNSYLILHDAQLKPIRSLSGVLVAVFGTAHFILLFVVFLFSELYHGTALSGKIEGGRYFVEQHGYYTEVSRNVYVFSEWHMNIFLINSFALGISGFLYWVVVTRNE